MDPTKTLKPSTRPGSESSPGNATKRIKSSFAEKAVKNRSQEQLITTRVAKRISDDKYAIQIHPRWIQGRSTVEIVKLERDGVEGKTLKDLSKEMGLTATRMFEIVGVPPSTVHNATSGNKLLKGGPAYAVVGLAQLLKVAQSIVDNSTAKEAKDFDTAKWLGRWLETAQPALQGLKPADFMDTPTGRASIVKVLGATESGAYL